MEVINSAHGLYCERCMYVAPGPKGEIISKKKSFYSINRGKYGECERAINSHLIYIVWQYIA